MNYEVIVVGGGHAGCEAALATSRLCHKTLLVTGNFDIVAQMPCNPSIGGSAKGIVVREIDALGGEMGKCADKTLIQMKMLNTGKGPAVRSLRCQADKVTYPKEMLNTLKNQHNLDLLENMVENLIIENREVKGIILENGEKIYSRVVILTTGTYLKSDILVGNIRTRMGPMEQKPSLYLSDNLKKYGFEIIRLKTGTPQRIEKSSIDFSKTKIEQGSEEEYTFSFDNKVYYDVKNQVPCHLVHSTKETKQIILDNLNKSSIYGAIEEKLGVGPRYCPSFEDKIVKFEDKDTHQIFLEPESLYYDDIYLQGFSTSMPREVQDKLVHSLPGLENAIIKKYAYAIEYDAINPTQLKNTLETKIINNLFTAGQINGTSGYEEAACQGLMAGINAVFKLENKEPFVLTRNEAYIGVLIDDLITKGTSEPYRLLTSRAEYRLLLRHDNADLRLMDYGYKIGLIEEQKHQKFEKKKENINELKSVASSYTEKYGERGLEMFLNEINLIEQEQEKNQDGSGNYLNLMTLHSSKGLEFDYVFMVGMEEGLLPHSRSFLEEDDMEEERRLCYVGITRARQKLFMTFAERRQTREGYTSQIPSRFLGEIPQEICDYYSSGDIDY